MANLVTVTKESRIFLKVGGVILGALILIYFIFKGGALMRNIFFPKPPPIPQQALGPLPPIEFPSKGSQGVTYTVNTVDGNLPILADRINVYTIKAPEPNLLALQTAKNTLDSENFVLNQIKKSSTLYQWTQAKSGIVIEYDITTKNFTISSNYLYNPALSSNGLLPDEESIESDVLGFLQGVQANTESIDRELTKVEYLENRNGALVAAQNLGSARYARVTFQNNAVDEIPIVYTIPGTSLIQFVISYPSSGFQVLEGTFFNYNINLEEKSDYPIKTAQKAYEDLQNGNAYVINPQNLTNVDITNVELRYFLSQKNLGFLLPVIVFTGVNNFTAYVDAIPSESQSTLSP